MNPPSLSTLISWTPTSLGCHGPLIRKIQSTLASSQYDIELLSGLIEKEVDLTSRLLRLTNSAYYGLQARSSSVAHAVNLLGIQQLRGLLEASVILDRFSAVPDESVDLRSFWEHSVAVAVGTRFIAAELELPNPEDYFVFGLLHDIGRLVLFRLLPTLAKEIFELRSREGILLREAEYRVLGYDHQNIAEELLKKWRYPAPLVLAVANHHQPFSSESGRFEASLIHVADHFVNAMELGTSGERFVPPLNPQAWELLRLEPAGVDQIISGIDEQFEAVRDLITD